MVRFGFESVAVRLCVYVFMVVYMPCTFLFLWPDMHQHSMSFSCVLIVVIFYLAISHSFCFAIRMDAPLPPAVQARSIASSTTQLKEKLKAQTTKAEEEVKKAAEKVSLA